MFFSQTDKQIEWVLGHRNLRTVEDVSLLMDVLLEILDQDDGIAIFLKLYRRVTESIQFHMARDQWNDRVWVEKLVVGFAELCFSALLKWLQTGKTREGWQVFFERRYVRGITPAQHAIAGINNHINIDLAKALAQISAWEMLLPESRHHAILWQLT